jgi:hypothetical protein
VPLQNITLSGALANALLVTLALIVLLVVAFLVYQVLGLPDDVPGIFIALRGRG